MPYPKTEASENLLRKGIIFSMLLVTPVALEWK